MYRVKADATPYLNVRSKGSPAGDIVGFVLPGENIEVKEVAGNWFRAEWRPTPKVTIRGWMSGQYIEQVGAVYPLPVTYRKAGLHFHTGDNIAACMEVVNALVQAGKPMPLAVVVNNGGLVAAIKKLSPNTFTVYRGGVVAGADVLPLVKDDPDANIRAGKTRFEQRYTPCGADAYQIANEHYAPSHEDWQVTAMSWFYVGAMYAAEAKGVKVTVGDFSAGTPEPYHLELMKPMLQKANDDGHYLNYHAYAAPDVYDMTRDAEWWAMRWLKIIEGYPKLGVVLAEMGGFHQNSGAIMALVRQLQAMTATYANVKGFAVFTANAARDWQDKGFGFDPYLPEFSAWLRTI